MEYRFLSKTQLFCGIREDEIHQILSCLGASEKTYRKNETIFRAGDTVQEIGLVECGSVNIVVNFLRGSSHIFGHAAKGDIFAENYAAIPEKALICDVVAAEDAVILFLKVPGLITACQNACKFHQRLIRNLLQISAQKSLHLSARMMHTAPRGIRDRLLSYLSEQAMQSGSDSFVIPFDRRQLAEYLGVDRSAMSHELGKMQRDGRITFRKNKFILHDIT